MSDRLKKIIQTGFCLVLLLIVLIPSDIRTVSADLNTTRPSKNGHLHVEETQLKDEKGNVAFLKGISTHGLTWYPEFIDEGLFKGLSEEWDCNLIRLAAYSSEYHKGKKKETLDVVFEGIEAAIAADMYVLVDWHTMIDERPENFRDDAVEFFTIVTDRYGNDPHLLYEVCNEPGGDWLTVKEYADGIIPVIRSKAPDAVIIIGTPNYCQDLHYPAIDPLSLDNIMYSAHFYSATHGKELREQIDRTIHSGLPVFISECGITEADGNGKTDFISAAQWFSYVNKERISYTVWSLSDKNESSAFFLPGTEPDEALDENNISQTGKWIRALMQGTDPFAIAVSHDIKTNDFRKLIQMRFREFTSEKAIRNWAVTSAIILPLVLLLTLGRKLIRSKKSAYTYADLKSDEQKDGKSIINRIIIILSSFFTLMYLLWRIRYSLPLSKGVIAIVSSASLLIVEILGFLESLIMYKGFMNLKNYDTPKIAEDEYPDVDIFIATYNEPAELLEKTINGCKHLDYPDKDKVHIWLCDDNRRPEIRELAEEMGIGYFDRPDNKGAKAGNLNHALSLTSAPYVVTLDADMIVRSCFLLKTIPFFVDAQKHYDEKKKIRLGLLQTPQCFYDPDVFQYALYSENNAPNEQDFFYRTIEVAKTSDNSVIYGGSNTVISRAALEAIGGFYTETITEDFATGMLIESAGFVSLALSEPLASGTVPKTYQEHIKQRTRWGRGVISTARQLHLLSRKGLTLSQKLSYWSSVVYWYSPLKNLIYMIAPLMYAVFNIPVFICNWSELLVYWLPMFVMQDITLRALSNNSVSTKWSGIYETSVMPFLLIPMIKEFFGVTLRSFKVTDKSGNRSIKNKDTKSMRPFVILLILHILGFARIIWLLCKVPSVGLITIIFWIVRNTYLIIMALFLIDGRELDKENVKVKDGEMVRVTEPDGSVYEGITTLMTEHNMNLFLDDARDLNIGEYVTVEIDTEKYHVSLKCVVTDTVISNYTDQRTHRLEIMDFGDDRFEYLQILYDRIPTLPQSLRRDFGITRHLWRNIACRIERSTR